MKINETTKRCRHLHVNQMTVYRIIQREHTTVTDRTVENQYFNETDFQTHAIPFLMDFLQMCAAFGLIYFAVP